MAGLIHSTITTTATATWGIGSWPLGPAHHPFVEPVLHLLTKWRVSDVWEQRSDDFVGNGKLLVVTDGEGSLNHVVAIGILEDRNQGVFLEQFANHYVFDLDITDPQTLWYKGG